MVGTIVRQYSPIGVSPITIWQSQMITVLDKLSPSSVLVHTHLGETTHSPALVLYPKWLEVARSTAKDGNTDEARVPATSHETR